MKNTVLGDNLKRLRENMKLNQNNLAEFLGVDQSLISKLEKGERSISADMLEKLSSLFGVSISEMENPEMKQGNLSFAFRASELNLEDLKAISDINRIALNLDFMEELLEEGEND
ncbi:MAG: helix-turn-helix transcriptional regulator [Erysipelotrichaceae bacterium]|nr:helix-turn-helix transcriptional regulator [Erysipelotrichaceae bacterium]